MVRENPRPPGATTRRLRRGHPPPPTSARSAPAVPSHPHPRRGRAAPSPAPALPVRAAVISAVSPPRSVVFGSAPRCEEQFDHRGVPVLAGERERRDAVAVRRVRVRLRRDQELGRFEIIEVSRPMQGGHAIGLRMRSRPRLLREARGCLRDLTSPRHQRARDSAAIAVAAKDRKAASAMERNRAAGEKRRFP